MIYHAIQLVFNSYFRKSVNDNMLPRLGTYKVTFFRKRLDPERAGNLVVVRDFMLKRQKGGFKLCTKCPQPPSPESCYVISCEKHNK